MRFGSDPKLVESKMIASEKCKVMMGKFVEPFEKQRAAFTSLALPPEAPAQTNV